MAWVPTVIDGPGSVQVALATPADTAVRATEAHSVVPPSVKATPPVLGLMAVSPAPAVMVAVYCTATPKGEGDTGEAVTTVVVESTDTCWVKVPVETV